MANSDLDGLRRILAARADQLHRLPNVVGTGIGNRRRGGEEIDELCIRVSVERKVPKVELRDDEVIPPELSVPGIGSCPTDVVETGRPQLVMDPAKYRPVRGGCTINTVATEGTLGGLAFDKRSLNPAWITCRHCLFPPSFFSPTPVRVVQPYQSDFIGIGTDVAPMMFGQKFDATAPGYSQHPLSPIDAGKGDFSLLKDPADVEFSVLDIGGAIYELKWPEIDEAVWKHGAATRLTRGRVVEVDHTVVDLSYRGGFYASVGGVGSGCVKIEAESRAPFVGEGDSGSVVFSQEPGIDSSSVHPAIGVLFAAGGDHYQGEFGYACSIELAFSALGLLTVCRGIYLRALKQARLRGGIKAGPLGGSFDGREHFQRFTELRAMARSASEPGRALVDIATAAVPEIADAVYRDPVAFGLYVRLMEKFALQATVLDILETTIDDETVNLFHRLIGRLGGLQPTESLESVGKIARALTGARGQRVADLVRVDLGD